MISFYVLIILALPGKNYFKKELAK